VVACGANAQVLKHGPITAADAGKGPFVNTVMAKPHGNAPAHSAARTTATPFLTEDFSSGAATGVPTGWSTGILSGGTWRWTIAASTSAYTMGAMMSTSASNGWMIFDSDSIGTACSCAPSGYLQSPSYSCTGHTTVRLNFENFYRSFYDSCSVWVSTSPTFATYQDFPVVLNDGTAANSSTANPSHVQINISSVAANQANVYIRFVYYGNSGGSYSWMIDDMSLTELDPIDIGLEKSCVIYAGSGAASFGIMPSKIVDTVYPVSMVLNNGATAEMTQSVGAQIFQGATSVYNKSITVPAPVSAYDSIADFSQAAARPGYYSATKAVYTVAFNAAQAGDADNTNNVDTASYIVSDTVWSENPVHNGSISLNGGLYVYRPASGPTAALAFSPGVSFGMPAGKVDTLTSVSVAFESTTIAGQVVGVQIYHFDAGTTAWVYDGVTKFRALTAADISGASSLAYANFVVDEVATGGKIILNGGASGVNYAAVVKGNSNTAAVVVYSGNNPADYNIVGYVGLADTSNNNGGSSQDFGNGHLPYGESSTPLVNLNFGPITTGVQNVTAKISIGNVYPNPANTSVNVPFTVNADGIVTLTISNMVGQTVKTQQINTVAGRSMKAVFGTSDLSDGVYLCTTEINGERTTTRIVVSH